MNHRYTDEDAAYVLQNYYDLHADDMAEAIGAPNGHAIADFARRLKAMGMIFAHGEEAQHPMEKHEITDGYDTVPWHMRIVGRNQKIPDLKYRD